MLPLGSVAECKTNATAEPIMREFSQHRSAISVNLAGRDVKSFEREAAAYPAKDLHDYKFWPHVGRVDNVFGDRNPVCSCVGMENYS